MLGRLRRWLTFANVCSFLALTIALGTGSAYAANTVFSTDIVDGEVKTFDIGDGEVKYTDIGGNQVTTTKIKAGNVGMTDLADNSVDSAKLQTDSVNASEIADNSIDAGEIIDNSLFAADLGSASVGTSELESNAVDGSKVADNGLTTADLAGTDNSGAITLSTGSVANGRCSQFDIAVSGAKANEGVIITARAALQVGVTISGQRVPSDGHVTMNVCNLSGTTMTALSSFPIRTITFGLPRHSSATARPASGPPARRRAARSRWCRRAG
jgi:hypothetical protein